jgi:hypothetical protein
MEGKKIIPPVSGHFSADTGFTDHAKIDGTTHFIKNIIYARDPSILDPETLHVNQRDAFVHENNLDVKKMMHR